MVVALDAAHGLAGLGFLVVEDDAVVCEAEAWWAGHGKDRRMASGRGNDTQSQINEGSQEPGMFVLPAAEFSK